MYADANGDDLLNNSAVLHVIFFSRNSSSLPWRNTNGNTWRWFSAFFLICVDKFSHLVWLMIMLSNDFLWLAFAYSKYFNLPLFEIFLNEFPVWYWTVHVNYWIFIIRSFAFSLEHTINFIDTLINGKIVIFLKRIITVVNIHINIDTITNKFHRYLLQK